MKKLKLKFKLEMIMRKKLNLKMHNCKIGKIILISKFNKVN